MADGIQNFYTQERWCLRALEGLVVIPPNHLNPGNHELQSIPVPDPIPRTLADVMREWGRQDNALDTLMLDPMELSLPNMENIVRVWDSIPHTAHQQTPTLEDDVIPEPRQNTVFAVIDCESRSTLTTRQWPLRDSYRNQVELTQLLPDGTTRTAYVRLSPEGDFYFGIGNGQAQVDQYIVGDSFFRSAFEFLNPGNGRPVNGRPNRGLSRAWLQEGMLRTPLSRMPPVEVPERATRQAGGGLVVPADLRVVFGGSYPP